VCTLEVARLESDLAGIAGERVRGAVHVDDKIVNRKKLPARVGEEKRSGEEQVKAKKVYSVHRGVQPRQKVFISEFIALFGGANIDFGRTGLSHELHTGDDIDVSTEQMLRVVCKLQATSYGLCEWNINSSDVVSNTASALSDDGLGSFFFFGPVANHDVWAGSRIAWLHAIRRENSSIRVCCNSITL
jgi:hypothetical protein